MELFFYFFFGNTVGSIGVISGTPNIFIKKFLNNYGIEGKIMSSGKCLFINDCFGLHHEICSTIY